MLYSELILLIAILVILFVAAYQAGRLVWKIENCLENHNKRLDKTEKEASKIAPIDSREQIEKTKNLYNEIVAIRTKLDLIYQNTLGNRHKS